MSDIYQGFAQRLRPKRFDQVIGQQHIVQILTNALKSHKIAPAYLFAGMHGVGKTTIARILARALRCQNPQEGNPCLQCPSCLDMAATDIYEIDAASNNGVDQIREIIASTPYLPTYGKYKIYIIDEVHMVTTSGFNALLKTLEEPPSHIVFILATTSLSKVPDTILSRCQLFYFKAIAPQELHRHLQEILQDAHITVESDQIIDQIIKLSKGSVRDSLTTLEQLTAFAGYKHITTSALRDSLGLIKEDEARSLLQTIIDGHIPELNKQYQKLLYEQISIESIASELINLLYRHIHQEIDLSIKNDEAIFLAEQLARDFTWIKEAILSDKLFAILLQKLALRRNYFTSSDPTSFSFPQLKNNISSSSYLAGEDSRRSSAPTGNHLEELKGSSNIDGPSTHRPSTLKDDMPSAGKGSQQQNISTSGDQNYRKDQNKSTPTSDIKPNNQAILSKFSSSHEHSSTDLGKASEYNWQNQEQFNLFIEQFKQLISKKWKIVELHLDQCKEISWQPGEIIFLFAYADAPSVQELKKYVKAMEELIVDHFHISLKLTLRIESLPKSTDLYKDFAHHEIIQQAEKIFNSRIDKVIID